MISQLFLIRHATAVAGEHNEPDAARALTAGGRREAISVGAALAKHKVLLSRIVMSPLVRAVQTAELIAQQLHHDKALHVSAQLAPDGNPHVLLGDDVDNLALVGHEPSLGNLLSRLLRTPGLTLQKCAVVCLQFDEHGHATRKWSLSPSQLEPK